MLQERAVAGRREAIDETHATQLSGFRSLSDHVTELLVRRLVSGELAQGQRINEAELARTLGISRNPIREAVSGLQERGIIIAAPRRGSFVRRFTTADVDDLFAFRMTLERFNVEGAVANARDADLTHMSRIIGDMMAEAESGDVLAVRQSDMSLHAHIARMSGNRQAINSFSNLSTEMLIVMSAPDADAASLQASAMDHYPIVEALRSRSAATAVEAMDKHLRASWAAMLRVYAGSPSDARRGAIT